MLEENCEMASNLFRVIRQVAYGAIFLLSLTGGAMAQMAQSDLLDRPIGPIEVRGEMTERLLWSIGNDYNIPIGIVMADGKDDETHEITLSLPATNLRNLLNAVIEKDPRYAWKLEEGVIHFSPTSGANTLLTALLNTKIKHFGFAEGTSRYALRNQILKSPELVAQLVVAGVEPLIFLTGAGLVSMGKGIWMDERDLTLREILDKLVLKTEVKQWMLNRSGKNKEFIVLGF